MCSKSKIFTTCMMLLSRKLTHSQGLHIPCRQTLCAMKSTWNAALKKRDVPKNDKLRKRQTIWKHEEPEQVVTEPRLDDLHYNQSDKRNREYARTWSNFPEQEIVKKKPILEPQEILPIRRRSPKERPPTAQPWDDTAQQFIKRAEANFEINRNKRISSGNAKNSRNYKFEITSPISDVYEPDKLYKFYY